MRDYLSALLYPTPDQLIARRQMQQQEKHVLAFPKAPVQEESPPPPGSIRVHFHTSITGMARNAPELVDDFPLDGRGGLDLGLIKRRWNLVSCEFIDRYRWEVLPPGDPNYLSGIGVVNYADEEDYISIMEGPVSERVRQARLARALITSVAYAPLYFLSYHTPGHPHPDTIAKAFMLLLGACALYYLVFSILAPIVGHSVSCLAGLASLSAVGDWKEKMAILNSTSVPVASRVHAPRDANGMDIAAAVVHTLIPKGWGK